MTKYNDGKIHGWNGGPCPVHPKTEVRYWQRYEGEGYNEDRPEVRTMDWEHTIWERNIIAFQVITPYIEPVPPRECWSFCGVTFDTEAVALNHRAFVAEGNPGKGYEDMPIIRWREVKE